LNLSSLSLKFLTVFSNVIDSVTKNPVSLNITLQQHYVPGWDSVNGNPNIVVNVLGYTIQELETFNGNVEVIKC
jgi:hypothetical protein